MMWLARIFASAIARRLAYLLVLLLLAWLGMGKAHAQSCTQQAPCDQGEAYSLAEAHSYESSANHNLGKGSAPLLGGHDATLGSYYCIVRDKTGNGYSTCPDEPIYFYYYLSQSCSARSGSSDWDPQRIYLGSLPQCVSGCKMSHGPVTTTTFGGVTTYNTEGTQYTGETCDAQPSDTRTKETITDNSDTQDECVPIDGQTACMMSNGDYCATSSTGKQFCWTPTQTGEQLDGNDAQVKGEQGEPVTSPDVTIPDSDWQRTDGHQVTICSGDDCTTYNITNFQAVPAGSANNSTGDNNPSGSTPTNGNDSTQTNGNDSSSSDSNGDGNGLGGVGVFYTSNGKTVAGIFAAFKARVSAAPIISATGSFFTVGTGGACPVFTVPASAYWRAMTYDAHCSGDFLAALQAIGWVLMAMAAFAAALWALS